MRPSTACHYEEVQQLSLQRHAEYEARMAEEVAPIGGQETSSPIGGRETGRPIGGRETSCQAQTARNYAQAVIDAPPNNQWQSYLWDRSRGPYSRIRISPAKTLDPVWE